MDLRADPDDAEVNYKINYTKIVDHDGDNNTRINYQYQQPNVQPVLNNQTNSHPASDSAYALHNRNSSELERAPPENNDDHHIWQSIGSVGNRSSKQPPPAPKSRHGKSLHSAYQAPRTVDFDNFAPNMPLHPEGIVKTEVQRTIEVKRDVVLPSSVTDNSFSVLNSNNTSLSHSQESEVVQEPQLRAEDSRKRSAPPPPLARRSTVTRRPRADTATSSNSDPLNEQSGPYDSTIPKSAPLPPARRSVNAIISPSCVHEQFAGHPIASNEHFSGRLRSSSSASSYSIQAPPPPPPRRQSSRVSTELNNGTYTPSSTSPSTRSSLDHLRKSSDNPQDGLHVVQIQQPRVSSNNPMRKSVLQDMDDLQKEIDELRAQYP